MVYFTQLVYVKEGQEKIFHQFEDIALPLIKKYNGRLLLRLRPDDETVIENEIEKPYEIHLVEFSDISDFEKFAGDEERKRFLHLKQDSVKSIILIKGEKV